VKEAFVKGEGTAEKASDMPMLNVRAKPELIKRVKIAWAHEEMTIQEFVSRAVDKELKGMGY
jgi:predicted DNA binding CopG/RHH family protein